MRKNLILIFCLFLSYTTFAQQRVSGVVNDSQNFPVPGVTVLEKGTTNGVITDSQGSYTIDVAGADAVLVYSFVGMETQEVLVGNQTTINVSMRDFFSDLDEVVVVGYGVQRKRLTTGANINVGSDDILRQSNTEALGAIQSQVSGVNIVQNSGMPGEGFKVNIRGLGTIGNSQPLYVIDGVAGGNINHLNPADIESIDILKDAASAAIYGSRAANGVILITTKRGQRGAMQVSYDGYVGIQQIENLAKPLTASQFIEIHTEERIQSGRSPEDWAGKIPGLYQQIQSGQWDGTNWMNEIYNKNAPIQNHAININGGSDQSVFSMGFSYSSQEGVLGSPVEPHFDRYTVRLNSDHTVIESNGRDIVKVGQTLNYGYTERSGIAIGGMYWNDVRNMLSASPLVPVYNDAGEWFANADTQSSGLATVSPRLYNPVAQMVLQRGMNESRNYNLNGSAYLQIMPIENLTFRSQYGYRYNGNTYRNYEPGYDLAGDARSGAPSITQTSGNGHNWTFENTLNYLLRQDAHTVDVLVGQSIEKWGLGSSINARNAYPTFVGFEYAYLDNTDGITAGVTRTQGAPHAQGQLASFFGRVNYDFNERYLLTLVMRADGSSNFARGNRWGYFPSVSAGWIMSDESFMQDIDAVDFLKLRASWGQNGNSSIDPFQYLALIGFGNLNQYRFGSDRSQLQLGGYPSMLANPDVSWETSEQLNIGVDAYFLRSRLQLAFDYYVKETKDWLVRMPLPAIYGADGYIMGPGSILSQGTDPIYRVETGFPIGYFYGYKIAGIFQNQQQIDNWDGPFFQENPQPGDIIFVDYDGDGEITPDDKTMIGNPHPDFRIGFGVNFAYRGFDFSVSGQGAFGHQIMQSYRSFGDNEYHNYTTDILSRRWHGEGTSNVFPRMVAGNNPQRLAISEIYVEDGDYVRIQNLTLGYDFKRLMPNLPLGQARLYVAANNLVTFTNYSGMDPEVGYGDDQPYVSGIDLGFYPSPRTYLIGLNLKF
ncbi:SusC/RagA family TonB-linked outer membrane protein [Alkalitalea saponilacus]|uniref:TonB-linked outer membrane protein, SusC/RagA family n=1 Tax=Alkalitalea saponilacus TaxID=889453 RepID=A0A1T5A234_9BACT|nr:TonB-dependent receptor [Alkalitalea saponilacus]ASB48900.1 SusC/RagA family TonB-linked outer membrane protein [Alkalitalea saponilacus]SKB29006.1 TonB-linked outer membrane protein, SusC/RagA family [Alkalitalea saponilacus]